jgi:Taurine catabolism dioxygenase TauD, TfdA family
MNATTDATPHFDQNRRVAWSVQDLNTDSSWILRLTPDQSKELLAVVRAGFKQGMDLREYSRRDFPLGQVLEVFSSAFREVRDGRGLALVKGLPREGASAEEFKLMTWVIGLHFGVARPQDRNTSYINEVKDVGVNYRSPAGRGYSSNAELDFHVDSSDVVLLSCYNQAPVGGMSMCTSSVKAFEVIQSERPDLAAVLMTPYPFSRNGEQPADESPWFAAPLAGVEGGHTFCVWNRNRLMNALKIEGVPTLSLIQSEAIGYLDAVVRRPDHLYCMHLEPGDLQILSNQTVLHSRTTFEDHPDEDKARTLYRLWLALPDSRRLPMGWEGYAGSIEPATVRGGTRGHRYDEACIKFDRRQAAECGMTLAVES